MRKIKTLWNFSRPHTAVGTFVSIITLFIIICAHNKMQWVPLLVLALAVGLFSNIFIVGINQIADVHIDKINKPHLPIPSGELSMRQAKIIVYTSLSLSLCLALFISMYLFFIIVVSSLIGWAYSMPPVHLKKHHVTAALAITIVRGVFINVGGFIIFNYLVNKSFDWPVNMKILTVFIIVFSVVIAWFKDLPDVEGDAKYNIKSLAITYSQKTTFLLGNVVVIGVYLLSIFWKLSDFSTGPDSVFQNNVLLYGNIFYWRFL